MGLTYEHQKERLISLANQHGLLWPQTSQVSCKIITMGTHVRQVGSFDG